MSKFAACPGLSFAGDIAECQAVSSASEIGFTGALDLFGIGEGCCVPARVFKGGKQLDFASLPIKDKWAIVRKIRDNNNVSASVVRGKRAFVEWR